MSQEMSPKVQIRKLTKKKSLGLREAISLAEIYDTAAFRKSNKTDHECRHELWIKRCSICGEILENDQRTNADFESRKLFYNDIDRIVCSFQYSKVIAEKLSVRFDSIFYWVYVESVDALTLRLGKNVPDNTIAFKAFTCGELCRLLLAVPKSKQPKKYLEMIAKVADNPTALARLLLKTKGFLKEDESC
jgi:hypothetical protein